MDLDMVNVMNKNYKSMFSQSKFHNGAKSDFRLIIECLASKCTHLNISCIAHSMEIFLTFSITNFNGTGIHTNTKRTHLIVLLIIY